MAATGDLLNDRYELEAELGRGQFGAVFRARDRVADERVAIKLILRTQADAVARVRRELKAARKVSHPGVVRIHDVFEVDGSLALSMELVEGETLERKLKREPKLPAAALSSLAADLARALAAAHAAGVTHRDLKPANIILRASNGRAVLTDFGISRILQLADAPAGGEPPPCAAPGSPTNARRCASCAAICPTGCARPSSAAWRPIRATGPPTAPRSRTS